VKVGAIQVLLVQARIKEKERGFIPIYPLLPPLLFSKERGRG
jgi:hypothetical protein